MAGFLAVLDVAQLAAADGFRVAADAALDLLDDFGAAGDFNGDGFGDIWVAAERPNGDGSAYLLFGSAAGFGSTVQLGQLTGANGFKITLPHSFKTNIDALGDFNGDGLSDLLIGRSAASLSGEVYLILGSSAAMPANFAVSALNGANGVTLFSSDNDRAIGDATAMGDVNGDGLLDAVLVFDGSSDKPGGVYVVFGRTGGLPARLDVAGLNGVTGFRVDAPLGQHAIADSVSVGDFNGDGRDDVLFVDYTGQGQAFVVLGKAQAMPASLSVDAFNGTNGFRLTAPGDANRLGVRASFAGDVNGDGYDDLLLTASLSGVNEAVVLFGRAQAMPATSSLSGLTGSTGFLIQGRQADDSLGETDLSGVGDVNGDGFDDLVIHSDRGPADLIFGKAGGFAAIAVLGAPGGTRIESSAVANEQMVHSAALGDVNGDGVEDFGVSYSVPNGPGGGSFYVVLGQPTLSAGATDGADILTGTPAADSLVAGGGNDSLQGLAAADRLVGGAGLDKALYAGTAGQYDFWSAADGSWRVKDLRPGSPEGTDTLLSVESLQFSDKTVKILGLTTAEKLTDAYSNILRSTASGAELTFLNNLIGAVNGSTKTLGAAITEIVGKADQTTAVAAMSYQFFLNFVPSKGGFDYLVSPQGPNPNNINSAYYQSFNIENRYINFAVNLGKVGEGAPSFLAEYGGKTLFQATKDAYMEIFGGTVVDSKINTILDSSVGSMSRAQYFALYGGDGLTGIGTKAAMVGWLLTEAAKADLGMYANSSNAFLTDLADGAQTLVDVVGAYGKAEYVFNG